MEYPTIGSLRIEFPGALYHITSRGDRREPIYEDDEDRCLFLQTLAEEVKRCHWLCYAYCLMTNHYHLVIETPAGNLCKGMRNLNGIYTQACNRRHSCSGHLFQGRYQAIHVDKESYLLELARYVVLNPVRAGIVGEASDWPWSSERAMVGEVPAPDWLAADTLLSHFGKRLARARQRYRQFVREGITEPSLWANRKQQVYLGDEAFIERMQKKAGIRGDELSIPKVQRHPPAPSIAVIAQEHPDRNAAMVAAYATGGYSYREIADYFGVHLATVGRIVRSRLLQYGN